MRLNRTDKFRQDAVRIALMSGLTRKQLAGDLGVGMSTLNKWITAYRDTDVVSEPPQFSRRLFSSSQVTLSSVFMFA